MARITVRVVLAVEVDADLWDETYRTGTKTKDIVNDVRQYTLRSVQLLPPAADCGMTVRLSK